MRRCVEILLKVPDNTAYTALVALRRLGVGVARVQRSQLYFVDDDGDDASLLARIRGDESLFNPNLHEARLREGKPQKGELWVRDDDGIAPATAWKLLDADGVELPKALLEHARDVLLCNAAIQEALLAS